MTKSIFSHTDKRTQEKPLQYIFSVFALENIKPNNSSLPSLEEMKQNVYKNRSDIAVVVL